MLNVRVNGILRSIEQWASASDDNMRLAIALVLAGIGLIVVIALLAVAWITLPPSLKLL